MPNSKKASHHHGKAGQCLSSGDHKGAAHHMGHALAALRQSARDEDGDEMPPDEPEPSVKPSLRGRLANMKRAST